MFGPLITLVLLSFALAWSVFFQAGIRPSDWDVTLLILGCASTAYWLFTRRIHRAPPLESWLRWLVFLFPAYVVFQLIPLQPGILQILSPARASLLHDLARVSPGLNSAPLSVNPPSAVLSLFTMLGYIVTFLLMRELAWRFSARPWTPVVPLIALALFEAGLGMLQVFAGWPAASALGTYTNRDHFAGLLETILPFAALYGILIFRDKKLFSSAASSALKACAVWAIAALVLLAIVYSLSRMGFLAALSALFTVGALAAWPRLRSRAWRWSSLGAIGVMIALIFAFFPPNQLIERFADISSAEKISADTRLALWRETIPLVSEYRFLGCGLGGFESVFLKHQAVATNFRVEFAHNDYLQYLAELGLVGFSILAAILVGLLVQTLRGAVGFGNESSRLLLIACAGGFVAILLHSVVDFNMYIPANAMTLAWIAGLASGTACPQIGMQCSKSSRTRCWSLTLNTRT
jgi:O-antigen ligase